MSKERTRVVPNAGGMGIDRRSRIDQDTHECEG
jgi:hypothetical protein